MLGKLAVGNESFCCSHQAKHNQSIIVSVKQHNPYSIPNRAQSVGKRPPGSSSWDKSMSSESCITVVWQAGEGPHDMSA